ncbi:hypothetical protein CY34DRAFT_25498 [Suillus luteus UH-Slu-Lm8-n1]|uniref:DDE-1 domain-containing protein n=1 Tax=Suillus luteus UH-Slu-Lm8-n1 TaxID=930992 RepID=A0A0C9ZMI0_9AGAM|nr:hypothetical protein CY34DRAFT_25498 [Suillus luteus UH-Slu-Lm8-n1]
MEGCKETVNGPMLRATFEEEFDVLKEERLSGDGWHCRYGEAGSMDLDAIAAQRIRRQKILAKYSPKDCWNFDETSFFSLVNRGLATKQMSGRKKDKFRISVGLACNADGSEKLEPFFIGRAKQPQCFKKQTPEQHKNWKICLFVNNFSAHTIPYEPSNIELGFFELNMTPFVQPCDTGIIRCFKAGYYQKFCACVIELDNAGEQEIYKINLLEGMMMVKEAWNAVTSTTIEHYWNHTEIQLEMSLPEAETHLEHHLADHYADTDWRSALEAIMDVEGNINTTLDAVDTLAAAASQRTGLKIWIPARPKILTQVTSLETKIIDLIDGLKSRNRIFGKLPTVEELLDPVEEREVGGHDYEFPDGDKDIVEEV